MWESLAGAAAALVAVPAALAVPIADTPVCCPYEDGCRFGCTTSYSLMPVGQAVFPVPTTTTTSSVYRYCFTYTEDITVTVTQPGDGSNTQATLTVTGPPVVGATSTSTISASPVTVTDFAGGGGNGVVFTTSTFTNTITQFASTVTVSDPRSTATQLITVKSPDLYRPIVDTLDQVPQAMADLATDGANTTNAWEQAAEEDIDPLDKALFAIDDLASRLVYKRGLDEDRCSRCGTCPCSCPPCTVCGEKECKCGGAVNLAARQGSGYENVPVDVHCGFLP